jgi:hypothetical protein
MAVDQAILVMGAAQKRFVGLLEEYLASQNIELPPDGKDKVGKLFTDAFQTYLMAEMLAFLCFALYNRLQNVDVLIKFGPEFLDAYEAKMGEVPQSLAHKTRELSGKAQTVLETGERKSEIVEALCRDLTSIDKTKNLRASFDALLLTLWGE